MNNFEIMHQCLIFSLIQIYINIVKLVFPDEFKTLNAYLAQGQYIISILYSKN